MIMAPGRTAMISFMSEVRYRVKSCEISSIKENTVPVRKIGEQTRQSILKTQLIFQFLKFI